MKDISFCDSDEFGILMDAANTPYVAVKLTSEQATDVKDKILGIYEIEGKQLFDIKDTSGKLTGEKIFYAVFV